jgi:hypothetical protein
MFDHVLLNVSNRKESMKFYTPVLQVLGIKALYDQDKYTAYGTDSFHFWLHESESKDVTRRAHLAFSAASRKQVDEFYRRHWQLEDNQMEHPDSASMVQTTTPPTCSTLRETI